MYKFIQLLEKGVIIIIMKTNNLLQEKPSQAPENALKVFNMLEALSVPYEYVENDTVESMEETAAVSEALGAEVRKSIFLTNSKNTEFYLVILPAQKRFDSKKFREALEISRVIDRAIKKEEYFACNPTDNKYHIKFKTEDLFEKILPKLGYKALVKSL
jgi:hypothetical protein CLOST_1054